MAKNSIPFIIISISSLCKNRLVTVPGTRQYNLTWCFVTEPADAAKLIPSQIGWGLLSCLYITSLIPFYTILFTALKRLTFSLRTSQCDPRGLAQ
jgi:hypothetical protein